MEHSSGGAPVPVSPSASRRIDMRSTPVPGTFTRRDGTTTEGTIRVVHAEGTPVPARLDLEPLPESTAPRYCLWHDAMVPPQQAVVMGAAPDDPTEPVYACRSCVRFHGLRTLAEQPEGPVSLPAAMVTRLVGRRTAAPGEFV